MEYTPYKLHKKLMCVNKLNLYHNRHIELTDSHRKEVIAALNESSLRSIHKISINSCRSYTYEISTDVAVDINHRQSNTRNYTFNGRAIRVLGINSELLQCLVNDWLLYQSTMTLAFKIPFHLISTGYVLEQINHLYYKVTRLIIDFDDLLPTGSEYPPPTELLEFAENFRNLTSLHIEDYSQYHDWIVLRNYPNQHHSPFIHRYYQ